MGERGNDGANAGDQAGGVGGAADRPKIVELGTGVFVATGEPPPKPGPGSLPVIPVPGGYIQFNPRSARDREDPDQ